MSAAQFATLVFAAPFLALALIFGAGLLALPFVDRLMGHERARYARR